MVGSNSATASLETLAASQHGCHVLTQEGTSLLSRWLHRFGLTTSDSVGAWLD